jgi:D-amino-acid dehydrogenase
VSGPRVVVIGGGVVGLSCAWFLREGGADVVIVERGAPGGGASRGSAGAICPTMAEPLPAPGMIRHAMTNLLRPDAALFVHPSYLLPMAGFLRRFAAAATRSRYESGLVAMQGLARGVAGAYEALVRGGVGTNLSTTGYLVVHKSRDEALDQRRAVARMASAGIGGPPGEILDGAELRAMEPILSDAARFGFEMPGERSVDPSRFVDDLVSDLTAKGVRINGDAAAVAVREAADAAAAVTDRDEVEGDVVVVAAGAWSARLVAPLGLRLPIVPGKGYSFALRTEAMPARVLALEQAHVMATPMGGRLRIAGTMEFDGTDRFNRARVGSIARAISPLLVGVDPVDPSTRTEEWVGARPMTPDGLPFLGRCPRHERVVIAAGHNMLGLTLAPVTGRAIAGLVLANDPGVDLAPFAPDRFTRASRPVFASRALGYGAR